MTIFLVLLTGSYLLLLGALFFGWQKIPEFKIEFLPAEIKFSIIVSYRNETENLPVLLDSLLKLKYPLTHFEVLLINDLSTDNSEEICTNFKKNHPEIRVKLLENRQETKSPKKEAITKGVKNANFDYIVTTDADCRLPELWLQAFNEKILKSQTILVAGPVMLSSKFEDPQKRSSKYLYAFQELDILSLQISGAGGFGLDKAFMANGANLCYERSAFLKVDGFRGNENISSGDDVFLHQKFSEKKYKSEFLKCKDVIVQTRPQRDLKSLISQRIRWAAKAPAYKSNFAKFTGLVVLLMNFSLILGTFLVFLDLIPYQPLLLAFLFKFNIDFLLLYRSSIFFERREILRNYFWSSLVYPFFTSAVAILSLFIKFEWKGRTFKK